MVDSYDPLEADTIIPREDTDLTLTLTLTLTLIGGSHNHP